MNFNRIQKAIILAVSVLLLGFGVLDLCFGFPKYHGAIAGVLLACMWLGVYLTRDRKKTN
jgi:hypothetical protein